MRICRFLGVFCAVFLLQAAEGHAAGFYLQEQSTTAMGTAFAGAAANPENASIIFYNPAGMTALETTQVAVNADLLVARSEMKDRGSTFLAAPMDGGNGNDAIPTSVIGNAYIAYPFLEDRMWFGVGVSTPFGMATQYDKDWFGRFDSQDSELATIDIQPSVAYRVTNWLSIGGGVDFQYADAELVSAASNGANEGTSTLKGHDWAVGYNAGVMLRPWEKTNIGLHYRSRVYHELDGKIIVENVPGLNEDSDGHADLNLPEIVSAGIAQGIGERWTLLGQVNWFGWDSLDKITAIRDNGTVASTVVYEWEPSLSYAIGARFLYNDRLTLRTGYQYDSSPVSDSLRATRVPDGDRHHFSYGASYAFDDNWALDMAGMYGIMSDADIDVTRNAGLARVLAEREDTDYVFLSLGVSYKFD